MRWIDTFAEWDRALPAALICADPGPQLHEGLLRQFTTKALGIRPELVTIDASPGSAPLVETPRGSGLYLSKSGRDGLAAFAVARLPVGVDIEIVDPEIEPPWNVLHKQERLVLQGLEGRNRALAFARIWSLKEAYLKALGIGLKREPSSFCVLPTEEGGTITDSRTKAQTRDALSVWRSINSRWASVSIVTVVWPA